ncbi:FecR domain-containing protein [Crenothrix polyspora]|uniref:Tetratricopeptide repeat domain-containing protein n=1 Tax=Crenothrix polyspora TaxID=360316 RepID=A0A1R4HI64_9GAMM|nr:FecR domain-containing protein [Crenothrix polyspora]SJM95570.1 Tetratricopeptide repeat domain-containing protein [Crenothrix polyspora]
MRYRAIPLLVLCYTLCGLSKAIAQQSCENSHAAKLVSLQGKLFFDLNSQGQWQPAQLNDNLCEGGRIRVDVYSRAILLLPSGIVLRLHEGTVLSLNAISPKNPPLLDMLKGFVHFISRTPQRLNITTPIANAGPEGTEFALRVDENNAALWVYEGAVKFFNVHGSVALKPGQGAQALAGHAPKAQINITPHDAVNWALYYPPLLPYPNAAMIVDGDIRSAVETFRQGDVDVALSRLDALASNKQIPYFFKVRAAMRLTVGLDGLALQDIQTLLADNPKDAEALALQSIRALSQNRKDEAYALATQAITADPRSASAYSALSYAEQGRFALDNALQAAEKATQLAPHDAMVWARKAELELSLGLLSDSNQAAQQALALDARLERTQTVMGFSQLLRININDAVHCFEKAITLDSSSPLARLGLGLAKIRQGNLAAGRQELEIAATLDPSNALIRSYLGKAYYEEKRDTLAEDQFDLAKLRDAKDPTPYFYDALRRQANNQPVAALRDMQQAIKLNDNRGVYRSKLMLDQDSAARTANLARLYNDLGFGRVALKEAWKALGQDSSNPSAHRFLSDAYVGQPRYRAARASELLQAQLLQPINITPVQPQLTSENIGILNSTGPGSLSLNEYDPLYTSNGAHLVLNGAYGSNNTKTDNAIISAVYDRLSLSLGQFHYQTDGFRVNDAYQQDIYNAFAQYAFTPDLSVQLELKSDDVRAGDVAFRLNGFHRDKLSQAIEQDTVRVGGHLRIDAKQNVIATYSYATLKDIISSKLPITILEVPLVDTYDSTTNTEGHQAELQYTFKSESLNITIGGGYLNQPKNFNIKETRNGDGITEIFPITKGNKKTDLYNVYIYLTNQIASGLTSVIGLSFDSIADSLFDRQQFSPKFGFIWKPKTNLTLRSAVFRTLKRLLVSNQTIEPTQIAGFNQSFDEFDGTGSWQYAFGVDYNPFDKLYLGGEVTWRNASAPVNKANNSTQVYFQRRDVLSHVAYFYWTPADWLALKAEYKYDKFDRDFDPTAYDPYNPGQLTTQQVPLSVSLFHPGGFFAKLTGIYVDQQSLEGVDQLTDVINPKTNSYSDHFWTFDASVGYRFPKKLGVASLEVKNLFDNHFRFQSAFDASGPQTTPFVPERQLFLKLSLFY